VKGQNHTYTVKRIEGNGEFEFHYGIGWILLLKTAVIEIALNLSDTRYNVVRNSPGMRHRQSASHPRRPPRPPPPGYATGCACILGCRLQKYEQSLQRHVDFIGTVLSWEWHGSFRYWRTMAFIVITVLLSVVWLSHQSGKLTNVCTVFVLIIGPNALYAVF